MQAYDTGSANQKHQWKCEDVRVQALHMAATVLVQVEADIQFVEVAVAARLIFWHRIGIDADGRSRWREVELLAFGVWWEQQQFLYHTSSITWFRALFLEAQPTLVFSALPVTLGAVEDRFKKFLLGFCCLQQKKTLTNVIACQSLKFKTTSLLLNKKSCL